MGVETNRLVDKISKAIDFWEDFKKIIENKLKGIVMLKKLPSKELVFDVWFNGIYNEQPVIIEEVSNYIDENQIALLINGFDYYDKSYKYTHITVNIYELASKCKIKALEKNIELCSTVRECRSSVSDKIFTGDTEPEAIFTAYEWILLQIKDNK